MIYVPGRLGEIHATLLEALCLIEALSRLGFGEGKVGVLTVLAEPHHAVGALLSGVSVGDRVVIVRLIGISEGIPIAWYGVVGQIPDWSQEEFLARWIKDAQTFLDAPASESESVWNRSKSCAILPQLEMVLRAKGFEVKRR